MYFFVGHIVLRLHFSLLSEALAYSEIKAICSCYYDKNKLGKTWSMFIKTSLESQSIIGSTAFRNGGCTHPQNMECAAVDWNSQSLVVAVEGCDIIFTSCQTLLEGVYPC